MIKRLMSSPTLLVLGLLLSLGTFAWWWLVFRELISTNSMSLNEALPCMAAQSDLCSLAQALCKQNHVLGIKRYDVLAFWVSALVLAGGLIANVLPRRSA
ncbi:hypothetical protein [Oryzibacter oryziterrae]|uniref:hypothetical protein n=1 Tax=Oryzibacter oryziterrae TaxID=2766474 RepID=UPI001F207797|nr:hypothetical protein [Oryzibacter oryziterrae]